MHYTKQDALRTIQEYTGTRLVSPDTMHELDARAIADTLEEMCTKADDEQIALERVIDTLDYEIFHLRESLEAREAEIDAIKKAITELGLDYVLEKIGA